MSLWKAVPLTALTALLLAAPASAAPIAVEFDERAGDVATPGLDLHSAGLAYDRQTGDLAGLVTLGTPADGAVINSIDLYLGRFAYANGRCNLDKDVSIQIPDAEEIAEGALGPWTELYPAYTSKSFGPLPTSTSEATIAFSTNGASEEIKSELRNDRYTCAEIETTEPADFNTVDWSGPIPIVAGPRPGCRVTQRRVQAGRPFPIRCHHAGKRVTVLMYKGRSLNQRRSTWRVRDGRLRVATTSRMRGTWSLTVWKGDVQIAAFKRLRVR